MYFCVVKGEPSLTVAIRFFLRTESTLPFALKSSVAKRLQLVCLQAIHASIVFLLFYFYQVLFHRFGFRPVLNLALPTNIFSLFPPRAPFAVGDDFKSF